MTKKIVCGAVLALVIVGLVAPSASANCASSKFVSTFNSSTGAYAYWKSTLTTTGNAGAALVAKVWQPGGADVSGTCNTFPGILYFGANVGDIGMNYNLSDSCVQPVSACAVGQVAVLATVSKGGKTEFLTTQSPEANGDFFFSGFGDHPLVALPRPRITLSSRSGGTVTANVTVDAANVGAYEGTQGLVTGYNILSQLASADPGRNASAYTTVQGPTLAATSGGPASTVIPVDCSLGSPALNRRWVVTQLVTANGPLSVVSEATQVSCDPSLADPKYKIVPKPHMTNSKAKH